MTKGGRIAGAILCLIGGGLSAMWFVMGFMAFILNPTAMERFMILGITLMFLVWTIAGVLGGILLFKDNGLGGFFPLLSGTTFLLFFFVDFQMPNGMMLTMGGGGMLDPAELAMLLLGLLTCLSLMIGGILGFIFRAEGGES